VLFPAQDALGAIVDNADDQPRQIVGIVADVRRTAQDAGVPTMYFPTASADQRLTSIAVRTDVAAATLSALITPVARDIEPGTIVTVTPYASTLARQVALPRFQMLLFVLFGVLGIVLAAVGIFGVLSTLVTRRTREIGIRLALGATASRVHRLVIVQSLGPVCAGVVIGTIGAWWLASYLESWLFEVPPHDAATLASAIAVLIATAAAASYLPARRASRLNIREALGSEPRT
jgi:ABC-type antimicrobial peptide transport system permease subunit